MAQLFNKQNGAKKDKEGQRQVFIRVMSSCYFMEGNLNNFAKSSRAKACPLPYAASHKGLGATLILFFLLDGLGKYRGKAFSCNQDRYHG